MKIQSFFNFPADKHGLSKRALLSASIPALGISRLALLARSRSANL